MTFKFLCAAGAIAAAASPAGAAIMVIGDSLARSCYEAADNRSLPREDDLATCNRAMSEEALSVSDPVATLVNRGILYSRRADNARALADYDEALARDPGQPEAYFNKGALLLRTGSAAQAVPLFDAAIGNRTKFLAGAYYGRGVAHEQLGNIKAAYYDYRRATEADPKWREPQIELARFSVRR